MHSHSIDGFRHKHLFLGDEHRANERKTWAVIALCGTMMVAEIGGGALFGSMALIADGLHMCTHAGALLIAALAYTFARRHVADRQFTFGTGKVGDLAAFASAIVLAMIALLIGWESVGRFLRPVPIAFDQAIPVAVLGLCVNLASAWMLRNDHPHSVHHQSDEDGHDHAHAHAHAHGHRHRGDDRAYDHPHEDHHRDGRARDLNLRAAYVHVLADAAVSILAIVGLVAGRQMGWIWMDPLMGIVGTCVIANWSWGLARAAGATLLDAQTDASLAEQVVARLETGGDLVSDLHLWRVGPGHTAAVISVVSDHPEPPAFYKARLADLPGLSHVTVEVQPCR